MMYFSKGILQYNSENKLTVEVDSELARYYRWFIPKSLYVKKPLFSPHISVIRKEEIIYPEFWDKYNNVEIEFHYNDYVNCGNIYCWLEVKSEFLKQIRLELGLTETSSVTRLPDLLHDFHITIGNFK